MLEGSSWAQFQFMQEQPYKENFLDIPLLHTVGPQLTGAAAHSFSIKLADQRLMERPQVRSQSSGCIWKRGS